MNYSNDESSVRVDFFRTSGKWYCTEAVNWQSYTGDVREAFRMSLRKHLTGLDGKVRLQEMQAVCLHPYHENAHPVSMQVMECLPVYKGSSE